MKTNICILLMWLGCVIQAQGQTSGDFVEMSPDFCTNNKIIRLDRGDTLQVSCDSVIVLSNDVMFCAEMDEQQSYTPGKV